MIRKLAVFGGFLLASGEPLSAQLVTDRPDFVEAAAVVGSGRFQVETSTLFATDRAGGIRTNTVTTPTLFRIGVTNSVELRIESPWLTTAKPDGNAANTGLSDISLGAKFMVPGSASVPVAVLLHADLPTGSDDFKGDEVRPSVRVTTGFDFGQGLSAGAMAGVVYDNGAGGRFASGLFGAVLGKSLTDRLGAFVEIAVDQIASDANGGVTGSFDFGWAFQFTDRLQLDAAAVVGLNDRSDDLAVTLGFSALFGRE